MRDTVCPDTVRLDTVRPGCPEILAPAGNFACLTAACEAGANAVYLGVGAFSARHGAGFSLSDCVRAADTAHGAGVKVYGALNIILFNRELPQVRDTVAALAKAGFDGIIAQDMAVIAYAREYGIPVHASTQVAVSDVNGAVAASRFGFSRVVLAREMSRGGIAEVARSCDIETEVFVCGALCASVSGLCGMSVAFSGRNSKDKRSGNRGTCAQPCRLDFRHGSDRHVLSMPDLFLLPYIGELAAMGVTSLKIEGRLRSPQYVRAAVTAVRTARDGDAGDTHGKHGTDYARAKAEISQTIGNRAGFCDFYYNA